mmetsp:Transcript_8261/g.18864  ORF Transcript_8261/g.18864 Transcript_8261/m.18864 type:complete len:139 (+) Transcript_8261:76-492(+)
MASIRILVLALLVGCAPAEQPSVPSDILTEDDACLAHGEGAGCSLNALQSKQNMQRRKPEAPAPEYKEKESEPPQAEVRNLNGYLECGGTQRFIVGDTLWCCIDTWTGIGCHNVTIQSKYWCCKPPMEGNPVSPCLVG